MADMSAMVAGRVTVRIMICPHSASRRSRQVSESKSIRIKKCPIKKSRNPAGREASNEMRATEAAARTKSLKRSQDPGDPLAAVAHKLEQEREHVDEVEVEAERPHHGFAARRRAVVHRIVEFLDLLGIPSRQSGENPDPKDRDHPLQH